MIATKKKNEVEKYSSKKLRINEYYDVDQCVATKSIGERVKEGREELCNTVRNPEFYKKQLFKRVPMIEWLITYKLRTYLQADIISGFTVGIMNIPQGMGYAMLASLPPVAGLYISFFPVLIYGIFGTSRHLAIGSIAIVSLLTGSVVDTVAMTKDTNTTDTDSINALKFKVVCSLSLLVGILQFLMGVFGLGIISSYFSQSFISGYTTGSAIHVFVSQITEVFGLEDINKYNGAFKIPLTIIDILKKMATTNFPTVILSAISMIYLIIFKQYVNPIVRKKFRMEFPTELLLVIVTTIMSAFLDFQNRLGISIVGNIPKGLPSLHVPDISIWSEIIKDAIVIALVAFSINASLGTLFARKHKYRIYPTQELFAYGISNAFSSFFSCYPSAASLSRSSVLESTGGKTPLGPLLSSIVILFVILFLNPYFQPLPNAVLASIITVALKGLLFQFKDLITFWRYSKLEALVWVCSFLGVALLDVDIGLVIGLVVSMLTVIIRDQIAKLKGLKKHEEVYVDKDYVLSKSLQNVQPTTSDSKSEELSCREYKVYKIQSSIYFANIEKLKKLLEKVFEPKEDELETTSETIATQRSSLKANKSLNDIKNTTTNNNNNNNNSEKFVVNNNENTEASESSSSNQQSGATDNLKYLILDFAGVNHVDSDSVKMLKELITDFNSKGIKIHICQFQDYFIRMLHKMKLIEFFDPYLYLTIQDAICDIEKKNPENLELEVA